MMRRDTMTTRRNYGRGMEGGCEKEEEEVEGGEKVEVEKNEGEKDTERRGGER